MLCHRAPPLGGGGERPMERPFNVDRSLVENLNGGHNETGLPYVMLDPEFEGVESVKIMSSLISLLGCFFIIVTYLLFPPLRQHHSAFILWMALMGMMFHGVVIIQIPSVYGACCSTGPITQLSMVAQEFYFFVLAFNFYYTTKYPFHHSRWLVPVCHGVVWAVSIATVILANRFGEEAVNAYGFCWYSGLEEATEKLILKIFVLPVALGYLISIAWYVIATKRVRYGTRGSQHTATRTNLDTMRRYLLWSFAYWWLIAVPYWFRHQDYVTMNSPTEKTIRFIGRLSIMFKGTLNAVVWAKSTSMRNAYQLWKQGNWDDYMKVHEATWVLRREIVDFATKGIQHGAALAPVNDQGVPPNGNPARFRPRPVGMFPLRFRMDAFHKASNARSFELQGSGGTSAVFRDFEPDAFHQIRKMSGISSERYLQSFAGRTRERFSSGKSGSFLYYTGDRMFILKTCTPAEQRYLLTILPQYMEHLRKNPKSYLCRYVGCHELVMEHHSVLFIVLTNILNNPKVTVDEFYDLKGSWVGRFQEVSHSGAQRVCKYCGRDFIVGMSKEICEQNPVNEFGHEELVTGKDLNWSCRKLGLPSEAADQLGGQLYADCEFLERISSMDYSLIIGLSRTVYGVAENGPLVRTMRSDTEKDLLAGRYSPKSAVDEPCIVSFETPYINTTTPHPLRSSSIGTEVFPGSACVVYMGIIDILTPWSIRKSCEQWLRVNLQCKDRDGISCVDPTKYAERFCRNVIDTVIFGGCGIPRSRTVVEAKDKEMVMVDFASSTPVGV